MTNKYKGIVEVEIAGEKRGFKFGMAAMAQLCQLEGCEIDQVSERLSKSNIGTLLNLLYSGAVQYARINKSTEPTYEEVADWADHLGPDAGDIITSAIASPKDPN